MSAASLNGRLLATYNCAMTPLDAENTDTTLCPLCGSDNACARAADPTAENCWCSKVTFPAAVFEQLPAEEKNRRCICAECVEKARRLAKAID